jgi:hypothetical protein
MNRPDDEFDDFLMRRKPMFRGIEDPLEPPDELDRLVLHQAREAVEGTRPQRVYKGPRWAAPLAIAATLVLALTVIIQVGMPAKPAPIPEVTVQTVSQRIEYPAAPALVVTNDTSPLSVESAEAAAQPAAAKAPAPDFRGDPKTWLAEIERLRAAGKAAQADAEYAEYKRLSRAYAVSPDR